MLIRWTRITRLVVHLAQGLLTAAFLFPLQSAPRQRREIERWSLGLLEVLAVRVYRHGASPPAGMRPLLVVANHVSWLDIFAINAIVPVRFVAKSEVRAWPLIGWLCHRAGTLFIERSRRDDIARINGEVTAAMMAGDIFAVFPEGTTTDGSAVLKFHASLLEPAMTANAAVQPIALRYERSDGALCTEAAFDGRKTLWDTLMGITAQRSIIAHVSFLQPIYATRRHRRDLARDARDAIILALIPPTPRSDTETTSDLQAAAR